MPALKSPHVHRAKRSQFKASTIVVLCLLLAIPSFALSRLSPFVDWRIIVGAGSSLSLFAFLAYRSDKRSAEAGEWRVSEATLHFLGVIGGWPGAFLAQRVFRHKTSKASFQAAFWIVVFLHQFAAIDSLLDWRFTKQAIRAIKTRTA